MTQTVVSTGASAGIARATAGLYGAQGASAGLIARKAIQERVSVAGRAGWLILTGCSATPSRTSTPARPDARHEISTVSTGLTLAREGGCWGGESPGRRAARACFRRTLGPGT
jgi:NAD(P)-dependent dehydrogenase (short-subunit alcohol dehydrogenase family)